MAGSQAALVSLTKFKKPGQIYLIVGGLALKSILLDSGSICEFRAHTIETQIDFQGDEEGVIVAVGGMTGGYTMFVQDNRVYYDYNFLDGVHYILKSPPLPKGVTGLKFNFTRTMDFGGKGELYVNGEKVDEVEMPQMHISTYSLAETFDVGRDTGTQVSSMYEGTFEFNQPLDRVIFTVSDDDFVPPRKLPAAYY